ncbi:MAG: hypothetical protein JSR36_13960 [Proteobacteria bacterium]|nr:hypothetical protein [Pseudomonadota bacterium]
MNARSVFPALLAAGILTIARAEPPVLVAPWQAQQKSAAVASCRAAILDNVAREYLARNHLAEGELPPDFRTKVVPVVEPLLKTCDCSIAVLSGEVTYAEFQASTPRVVQRTKDLVAKGGTCAAPSDP